MDKKNKPAIIIQLLNNNTLKLYFDDDTYTYISPDIMKEIFKEYLNN